MREALLEFQFKAAKVCRDMSPPRWWSWGVKKVTSLTKCDLSAGYKPPKLNSGLFVSEPGAALFPLKGEVGSVLAQTGHTKMDCAFFFLHKSGV